MGFEIQSYIPSTHEMKNRILSKNKGCLMFFRVPKIYQLPEYYMKFARKILFLSNLGTVAPHWAPFLPSPTPMVVIVVNIAFL